MARHSNKILKIIGVFNIILVGFCYAAPRGATKLLSEKNSNIEVEEFQKLRDEFIKLAQNNKGSEKNDDNIVKVIDALNKVANSLVRVENNNDADITAAAKVLSSSTRLQNKNVDEQRLISNNEDLIEHDDAILESVLADNEYIGGENKKIMTSGSPDAAPAASALSDHENVKESLKISDQQVNEKSQQNIDTDKKQINSLGKNISVKISNSNSQESVMPDGMSEVVSQDIAEHKNMAQSLRENTEYIVAQLRTLPENHSTSNLSVKNLNKSNADSSTIQMKENMDENTEIITPIASEPANFDEVKTTTQNTEVVTRNKAAMKNSEEKIPEELAEFVNEDIHNHQQLIVSAMGNRVANLSVATNHQNETTPEFKIDNSQLKVKLNLDKHDPIRTLDIIEGDIKTDKNDDVLSSRINNDESISTLTKDLNIHKEIISEFMKENTEGDLNTRFRTKGAGEELQNKEMKSISNQYSDDLEIDESNDLKNNDNVAVDTLGNIKTPLISEQEQVSEKVQTASEINAIGESEIKALPSTFIIMKVEVPSDDNGNLKSDNLIPGINLDKKYNNNIMSSESGIEFDIEEDNQTDRIEHIIQNLKEVSDKLTIMESNVNQITEDATLVKNAVVDFLMNVNTKGSD